LIQRTVVPTLIVMLAGSKAKLTMVTSTVPVAPGTGVFAGAGGVPSVEPGGVGVGVTVTSGSGVLVGASGVGVAVAAGAAAPVQLTRSNVSANKVNGINLRVAIRSSSPNVSLSATIL
jgi:hypothetical protein